jgi:putative ABC transport system permease protein
VNALGFAWRSLVRQPARAGLAVLGVAAIGALLFDMLMLSQGLVLSMRDLLDRAGWDVRVTTTGGRNGNGPRIVNAIDTTAAIAALPEVRAAIAVRRADARLLLDRGYVQIQMQGVSPSPTPPWTMVRGRDVQAVGEVVVNELVTSSQPAGVGDQIRLQGRCLDQAQAIPPVTARIVGVAQFPFDDLGEHTIAGGLDTLEAVCGGHGAGEANLILVRSSGTPAAAATAVRTALPELRTLTNEQAIGRFQENGFSYFRQISTVLTTITLSFALLLITVLLTVSVNQRLGEIAALRALGFSRRRVVADVLAESALIVGSGGLLSLPLGLLLAQGLDRILTSMPGLPIGLQFFIFEPRSLAVHVALLTVTAVVAALYPMRIVARLPIASTLRDEVIG